METAEEFEGEWYIVYRDLEGNEYDAIGPYLDKADAERVLRETQEPCSFP